MAFKLSMGQYWPGDTPLHRLDPRAKVACTLAVMVSTFFVTTPLQLCLEWATMLAVVVFSHVPTRRVLASTKPVVAMLCVLSICNLLLVNEGSTLVSFGPLVITTGGLWAAALYSLRLVAAVVAAALLLLTTTPTQLTDAFDAALAPFARLGLPAHELAMVFSLMLRFIPTLADEASAIMDAQASRGGGLGEGSLVDRVRAVVPVIVALLASSARHADGLSRALDARCFEGGAARSHWHPLKMTGADVLALLLIGAYVMALICLGFVG